ncbi:acylphosphatase, partial [Bradyrhizobium sp. CCBAU 21359]|uniref:acylphosphatase n=1 Tax=Bradyrhizobium sp. CCBAU 21359 TaxID=1325080 RepID=UPI0023054698
MSAATTCDRTRLRVRVAGAVQGVGFRPYVYRLPVRYGLAGFVINGPEGVTIEVEGNRASDFVATLPLEVPPLARIDHVCVQETAAQEAKEFSIGTSEAGKLSTQIVADAAACQQCLCELFDPESRHYLYPFVSCCHCGP